MLAFDLSDTTQAGLYPLDADKLGHLLESTRQHDLLPCRANFSDCQNKADLLSTLAETLAFPADFGYNWDALTDSLADLSWLPARGYVLILEQCTALQIKAKNDFHTMLDICGEISPRWAEHHKPFWTFLLVGNHTD